MSASEEVHPSESMAVQLTRMEGKIDRFGDRLDDVRTRLSVVEFQNQGLRSDVQRLDEQATAEQAKAVALAAALKEAESTRRQKSEQSFTPWQRIAVMGASLATIGGVVVAAFALVK